MAEVRLTNYNMASARLIGGLLFAPLLAIVFVYFVLNLSAKSFSENLEELLLTVLAPLGALAFGWMALTAVTSLAIGDELTVGTIFGSKNYPLTDIDQVVFGSEVTQMEGFIPVAKHLMMHVQLRSGRHVQVKLAQEEAQEVVSALSRRGLEGVFQPQAA